MMVRGNAIGAVGVIAFYLIVAGLLERIALLRPWGWPWWWRLY
jgi:hypothetical protein